VRVVCACLAVSGCLRSGAALVDVRLDVVPLPSHSSSQTVTGCWLGGYPSGRDWLCGERDVGGVLPRIDIRANVWGDSSIMTGVHERWCSSTLHIGWGLCDRLSLVLVCKGRYCLGGGVSSPHSGIEFGWSRTMSSTIPLPPREQLYNRYCSNKHWHTPPKRLGSSYLIVHVLPCPPPPPAHIFIIGPAVINTTQKQREDHSVRRISYHMSSTILLSELSQDQVDR
jgi:hypothetical protein